MTKEEAEQRAQNLRVMAHNKHRGDGSSARTVPYEGQFAVFIGTGNFRGGKWNYNVPLQGVKK